MKAIRIHETGDPDVMRLEDVEKPTPREGEVLIQVAAHQAIAARQTTGKVVLLV